MRWVILFGVVTAWATTARAQDDEDICVDGRVATEQTEGRCCWPGQRWSGEHNRCEGVPACPAGRLMQGEDCVEDAGAATAPTSAPLEPTAPVAAPTPEPAASITPASPGTEVRTRKNIPLMIAGSASFWVGYLWSVVLGIAAYQETTFCPDRPWFFFLPVAGGVMGAINGAECGGSGAYWMGIPAVAAQVAGIVLVALGFIDRPIEEDGSVRLTEDVSLVSTGDLGLGLRLSL